MNYLVKRYKDKDNNSAGYLVSDFSKNTDTPLIFSGTYVKSYMTDIGENLLHTLENSVYHRPPAKAIKGQFWFQSETRTLFIYKGDELADSTDESLWTPVTQGISTDVYDHIANKNNPHLVTKLSIGLDKVDNVPVFDKSLNLSDVVDLSAAQTNLGILPKSNTWSKAEADARYLTLGGISLDSDKLDGIDGSNFMKIASPIAQDTINATSFDGIKLTANNGSSYIETNGVYGTLALTNGLSVSNKLFANNSSASVISLNSDVGSNSVIKIRNFTKGNVGTTPVLAKTYTFDLTGIYVDNNLVYHENNKPTASEVGALPVYGKAVDTAALNGIGTVYSTGTSVNSILQRMSNGSVSARLGRTTATANDNTLNGFGSTVFRNSNADPFLRYATKQDTISWAGIDTLIRPAKGWICFNGSGAVLDSLNCTVGKLGTGRFRVYITTTGGTPVVMIGNNDPAVGPTSIMQMWVSNLTTTYFDVNTKISGYVQQNHYNSSTVDGYYFMWSEAYYDANVYTISFYY